MRPPLKFFTKEEEIRMNAVARDWTWQQTKVKHAQHTQLYPSCVLCLTQLCLHRADADHQSN